MERLSSIIDDLYAGTLDDAAWKRGFVGIADMVSASAALLFAFNPATGALLREENYRLDPRVLDDYRAYWAYHDGRLEAARSIPVGMPMTDAVLAIPGWRKTPIFNEFLRPSDAPYCMPVWLRKSADKTVALTLQGTFRRGPFSSGDQAQLRFIVPHVNRAVEIRDRLEAANVRADTLASCADRAHFGVVTLTADGKILDANAAAEYQLRRETSIRVMPDRTLLLREPAGQQLRRWLVSGSKGEGPAEYMIRIERSGGRPPISVLMSRVPERPIRWVSADPACILFLFDPDRELRAEPALVATDLGITARQAELAALLASGLELAQAAQRLVVSIYTARTHLKAIYAKTGLRSQAELARRIATGPAVRAEPP